MKWRLNEPHLLEKRNAPSEPFQHYFAQCEALGTIIYKIDNFGFDE